jgi:pimeloyl-ACP methyl ester carboxylesterase
MIMKRFKKNFVRFFFVSIFIWLFMAQCSFKFRISDDVAKANFSKKGVALLLKSDTIKGQQLHYAQSGIDTGITLLFIHGTPGSWDAFQNYLGDTSFAQKYRLISIDRPGFGYSNFGKAIKLMEQCAIYEQFIKNHYNHKPIYLIGHSLGGPIVTQLSASLKPLISGCVVLAGSVSPAHEPKEYFRYVLNIFPLNYMVPGAFRPSNKELIYFKKEIKIMAASIKNIDCPLLVIHGSKDQFVPVANAAFIKENNAKADIRIIENANHFIPWQHEKYIKNAIEALINKQQ